MPDFIATAASDHHVRIHDILYDGDVTYDFIVNGGNGNSGGTIERFQMISSLTPAHEDGFTLQGDWIVRDNEITADPTTGTCCIIHDSSSGGNAEVRGNWFRAGDVGLELDNHATVPAIQVGPNAYDNDLNEPILALDFAGQYKDAKWQEWFWEGTVTTGVHPKRWYPPRSGILMYHRLGIGTGPTGANLTMELLIDGSSSQTTDFRILAGAVSDILRNVNNWNGNTMQVVAASQFVEMNVLQVGSTIPGSDLLAQMSWIPL